MDGKFFIDYAKTTFDRAYEEMNYINNIWIKPRIMPQYVQLKFRKEFGEVQIVNTFIHPDDLGVEYYQDLKHRSWDF